MSAQLPLFPYAEEKLEQNGIKKPLSVMIAIQILVSLFVHSFDFSTTFSSHPEQNGASKTKQQAVEDCYVLDNVKRDLE